MTFPFPLPSFQLPSLGATEMAALTALATVLLGICAFCLLFGLLLYILRSVSLYKIAHRRGLRLRGLAWIPLLWIYVPGSIADDYDLQVKGKKHNRRSGLLILNILLCLLTVGLEVLGCLIARFYIEGGALARGYLAGDGVDFLVLALLTLVILVLAVIQIILYWVSLYKVYRSCEPDSAAPFIVLSIFFSLTVPFFLFAVRKRDLGLPKRERIFDTSVGQPPQERSRFAPAEPEMSAPAPTPAPAEPAPEPAKAPERPAPAPDPAPEPGSAPPAEEPPRSRDYPGNF